LLICKDQPFVILISGHKPFNLFGLLPLSPEHKIKGLISGNLKATGTLATPQLSGKISLENSVYEYEKYGIRFNKIKSDIIAGGNKISITNAKTEDGLGNKLTANGEVILTPLFPFKFNFHTDKFDLVGNPYLQGVISGKIDLVGNSEKAKASGNIELGPFEIKIPEHFEASIPELNVTKVIAEGERSFLTLGSAYQIMMDILVRTKDQVFVRGWGVNTLLKGKLAIEGSADEPIITGKLRSVRGKYREFGKLLNVEKGELVFDGKIPPSPYINIVGLTTEADTEIRLILSGSLFNPDVDIKATPELSDEDALSLLLFGENPGNISAFQALQLADSLRRLSGKGGGFDPLGFGRKVLGVDDISVKTESATSNKTVVGIGKYLTDRVYFEIEEGGETGSKTKIEVELTPKISIENINETTGGSTFGIKWRVDY
jgi:translocation and assembly module TamB